MVISMEYNLCNQPFARMDANGRIVGKPHQTYVAAGNVQSGTHATCLQTGGGRLTRFSKT